MRLLESSRVCVCVCASRRECQSLHPGINDGKCLASTVASYRAGGQSPHQTLRAGPNDIYYMPSLYGELSLPQCS